MPTPEEIREVLQINVRDPELMINIVDLGLVYDITVEDKAATIAMTLTSPGCPVGPMILGEAQRYVHQAFPELEEVNIDLVWTPFWNPNMMSEEAREEMGIF